MKWDIDKADSLFWIGIEAAKALCNGMEKKCGIRFTEHICYDKEHRFFWCTLEKENEKIGNFLVERFKDDKIRNNFLKDYHVFYNKSIKLLDKFDREEEEDIFKVFKKANEIYIKTFYWGFIAEPMDFVMPDIINNKLKQLNYTDKEINDMLAAPYISFLNKEKQDLIKNKDIKEHAFKYRWMQSDHMGRKKIPLSYFKERKKNIKKNELKELEDYKKEAEKRRKEIIKNKPLDKEGRMLIKIVDFSTEIHDIRKELFLRSIYTADGARKKIAEEYGYDKEELDCADADDIMKIQKGKKLDRKKLKDFAKEALLFIDTKKGIWDIYSGKKAEKIASKELKLGVVEADEFKGMTASPGKAKGRVKIILSTKEMNKMEKGDIIVASMTKPEIAPALHKAAAIVTDEGGVACHAAIVSREMKIPCIIGTKIATDVLKDGDMIEVDADKGIVRKI